MTATLLSLWQQLHEMPLLWLALTLLAYGVFERLYLRAGQRPLLHPVPLTMAAMIILLVVTGTTYETYSAGTSLISFLLGPATVALAVPLYRQVARVRSAAAPVAIALSIGSLTAIFSAVGIGALFGLSADTLRSLATKSITTPIAMGVAEQVGGIPALAAALVILTGILGAIWGLPWLTRLGIRDLEARGLAMGVASHGIGTVRSLQDDGEEAGAFAGLGMALNGALSAVLIPLLLRAIGLG